MSKLHSKSEILDASMEKPVLVDFWASWCTPCQVLGPVLEEAEQRGDGRWNLIKVDVEENEDLAREYKIMGIPAVKLFYKGKIVADFTGYRPLPVVEQWVNQYIQ